VAVKATANDEVLPLLAEHADRLLAPDGAVLVVQNGMGAEPRYAEAAPGRHVLGGLAFLCARRQGARAVEHLGFGALTIAALAACGPAGILPVMSAIVADLERARTEAHLEEDLDRARWRKLMWNIPFNPLSVILGATTDELMADPHTVQLVRSVMSEIAGAAAAEGRALPEDLAGNLLEATAAMAAYATSMRLDADAGRPMEVDAMLGEPLRRGARAGVSMPSVAVLHRQLSVLDRRNAQQRPNPPRHG
jgi:2-dehydropantoate 2-reductase